MIFKCKICGGNLDVSLGQKIAECEYCGVKQSISSHIEPRIQEIYNRASAYLMHNEFDKAENLYNQILFDNKADADAYWNVLMCRYGVTYVKDPATGRYIPTCNRTLYSPIFNDENYINAIKYADEKQKALYMENAELIDNIQKGILKLSQKEKPFDIFISYKETDVNGARTKDSIEAQKLYDKLTAEGYKVFFSRITLEDKIGSEYEPYIYAALASSRIMITVSSSKENIEAVWVRNEWSRFLSFAFKDASKILIPLYFNMEKDELPDDFAHIASYNMTDESFEQELLRGIKKLIPLPVMEKERREKQKKLLKKIGIASVAALIIFGIMMIPWLMKMPSYNEAMQLYYDKNYAEASWAFADLGSHRDSEEMKEKCELSWRKSLATVVVDLDPLDAKSCIYISPLGKIELVGKSNLLNYVHPDEHGKAISISGDEHCLSVIYEDGFCTVVYNDELSSPDAPLKKAELNHEWHDIIQIKTDTYNVIGLRADGRLVYHHMSGNAHVYDDLFHQARKWNNIVKLSETMPFSAITSSNRFLFLNSNSYSNAVYEILCSELSKVDSVADVQGSWSNFYILTTDNTIISYDEYSDKKINYTQFEDIVDFGYKSCILNKNYQLINNGKTELNDIVEVNGDIAISRTGSAYRLYKPFLNDVHTDNMNIKTVVYSEWIERMN